MSVILELKSKLGQLNHELYNHINYMYVMSYDYNYNINDMFRDENKQNILTHKIYDLLKELEKYEHI